MKDYLKNPNFYYLLAPIVAAVWALVRRTKLLLHAVRMRQPIPAQWRAAVRMRTWTHKRTSTWGEGVSPGKAEGS